MATVLESAEQRVLLQNVHWPTYLDLVSARGDCPAPKLTYSKGSLEIMSPSAEHEEIKDIAVLIVNVWAEEMEIDIRSFGSATFRREDLAAGFEPDACFYIGSAKSLKGKTAPDIHFDPPPDLIIEVDISSSSLNKLSMFADVGIKEVWRYRSGTLEIFELRQDTYAKSEFSPSLPGLESATISKFIDFARSTTRPQWLRQLRELARLTRN